MPRAAFLLYVSISLTVTRLCLPVMVTVCCFSNALSPPCDSSLLRLLTSHIQPPAARSLPCCAQCPHSSVSPVPTINRSAGCFNPSTSTLSSPTTASGFSRRNTDPPTPFSSISPTNFISACRVSGVSSNHSLTACTAKSTAVSTKCGSLILPMKTGVWRDSCPPEEKKRTRAMSVLCHA